MNKYFAVIAPAILGGVIYLAYNEPGFLGGVVRDMLDPILDPAIRFAGQLVGLR